MNILSNNCAAGDIYKRILHQPYQNPFIWTLFNPDDFIGFVENFRTVNLNKIRFDNTNPNLGNNFDIIIDNTYRIKHIHMWFDPNYTTPTIVGDIDVHYNKIWEYIYMKYITRLARMNKNETPVIVFLDSDFNSTRITELPHICASNNYPALIFTPNTKVVSLIDKNIHTIHVNLSIPFNPISVIKTYSTLIKEFCDGTQTV